MMRRSFLGFLTSLAFIGSANAEGEAEARKAASTAQLKKEGVPFIDHLPTIETEAESRRRTKDEVVKRAIALVIVAVTAETNDRNLLSNLISQFGAEGFFTPKEQAFVGNPVATEQDRANFSWRYEGAFVMLWALQVFKNLGRPDKPCDVSRMVSVLRDLDTEGLLKRANLRPQSELLDAADLIYRYNWAVMDARVNGKAAPAGLERDVVVERHYALNWLIGYMGQEWDNISTDT
ncbi:MULTISPECIES: DUF4272 domain-containing protein [unclassified Mesorhizobium]|uniref:DUF4272 domain-containing protein n=1 Tax=unclassified Mesorhizobium TaxID=325217 RepID=UPI0003CFF3F6|nr:MULTISPECIES: DUF4272 domain-containing protein [unclassified Mesorhizobium]ESZ09284.1 hypothetical protein X736_06435 [Mesorhizobium sp. L2C089B000]WJI53910.1 DUF4272 domain-containing protein [Mesorhizobium sp. C089B]